MAKTYGLIVIGGGSGGLVAAETARRLGASVALIESRPNLGGECLNSGCVPSKALIASARAAGSSASAKNLGVTLSAKVDFAAVMKHVHGAIKAIEDRSDNDERYQQLGIDVYHGRANFIDASQIQVNDQTLKGKRFIIATGSSPLVPPIPGLDQIDYLTNESIFELKELPRRLAVIGGGPIAAELGQAFAMLGSEVTLLVREDRLLSRDEPEAAAALAASFKEQGTKVLYGSETADVEQSSGEITINYKQHDQAQSLQADQLLVATGRRPNTEFAADKAGITLTDRKAIKVNQQFQTDQGHIYAIGDCTGGAQFTHTAAAEAVAAVQNALIGRKQSTSDQMLTWTTFTTPEIAHSGQTTDQLKKSDTEFITKSVDYSDIDRGVAEAEEGTITIQQDKDGKILGATVVGANAGEIMAQINLAVAQNASIGDIGGVLQAYPTYALGVKELAANSAFDSFLQSRSGSIVKWLIRRRFS